MSGFGPKLVRGSGALEASCADRARVGACGSWRSGIGSRPPDEAMLGSLQQKSSSPELRANLEVAFLYVGSTPSGIISALIGCNISNDPFIVFSTGSFSVNVFGVKKGTSQEDEAGASKSKPRHPQDGQRCSARTGS
jgi:hypothetical protein